MLEAVECALQVVELGLFKLTIENDNETDKFSGNIVEDLGEREVKKLIGSEF